MSDGPMKGPLPDFGAPCVHVGITPPGPIWVSDCACAPGVVLLESGGFDDRQPPLKFICPECGKPWRLKT